MRKIQACTTDLQKKGAPVRWQGREALLQKQPVAAQRMMTRAVYSGLPYGAPSHATLGHFVQRLQRVHGNRFVQSYLQNNSQRYLLSPDAAVQRRMIVRRSVPSLQRQGCVSASQPADSTGEASVQQTVATWDAHIEAQIEQFLAQFSDIQVTVTWQENGETRREVTSVHPPYFINRENSANRLSNALANRRAARGALRTLLGQIRQPAPETPLQPGEEQPQPSQPTNRRGSRQRRTPARPRAIQSGDVRGRRRALVGKSTPEDIQTILQAALDQGLVPAGEGRSHPDSADLRAWLVRYGIGVDCSGFVSQALNQVMSSLPGGAVAEQLSITDTNARALTGRRGRRARFTQVARPNELCPGDTMGLPGHIRIVVRVESTSEGIQITTAESSAAGDIGPTRAVWLYPDPLRFANLQRRYDGPPPPPRRSRRGPRRDAPPPEPVQATGAPPAYHWRRSREQVTWGRYRRLAEQRPVPAEIQRMPLTTHPPVLNRTRENSNAFVRPVAKTTVRAWPDVL